MKFINYTSHSAKIITSFENLINLLKLFGHFIFITPSYIGMYGIGIKYIIFTKGNKNGYFQRNGN